MSVHVVNIELSDKNTNVVTTPQPFNIEVEVDLKDIWGKLEEGQNNYIYIQTQLTIPTIDNESPSEVNIGITNNFKVIEIVDKKVTQYGYYEGIYDDTRKAKASSQVWKYIKTPLIEEEKDEFFNR